MNQDTLKSAKVTGETIGEVVVALVAIVHLLKKQPGFDAAHFDTELREMASRVSDDSTITKEILKQCISLEDD